MADQSVEISYTQVRVWSLTERADGVSPLHRSAENHHSGTATGNYVSHMTSLVLLCV